jgi:hypothetical protein
MKKTDRIIIEGFVWKSQQNGGVFNPEGISPAVCCGAHTGCQPKIIEYEDGSSDRVRKHSPHR